MEIDEFKLYCGDDIYITDKIIITQPTIREIKDFGEKRYFSSVKTLVSTGADLKWQLWDYFQIDYTKISDYDLFIKLIWQLVSSKKNQINSDNSEQMTDAGDSNIEEIADFGCNPLELVLKDIDFADFIPCQAKDNEDIVLYNPERDITIDKMIYNQIVDVVRKIHGFKRDNRIPANERTKMDMIEDARDEALASQYTPYKSVLRPLVSALNVVLRQCGTENILNMKICAFFDSVARVTKVKDSNLLLQSAYSGFGSLKGVDKSRLDWAGDLKI